MELRAKLTILADAAKYDASCASSGSKRTGGKEAGGRGLGSTEGIGICHSFTPDGRCISLLKVLLTNYCIYDCRYCVNRQSSDTPRARFAVDEVVRLTLDFYRRNYIEGLFLSSGIIQSPDYTMEQLAEVARSLREDHTFRGYIHLKAVPGAAEELIQMAGQHADRLSVNVELPSAADLKQLAPEKKMDDIEGSMTSIRERIQDATTERKKSRNAPLFAPAGQSTQMIVGATPTPDAEILATASQLYADQRLRRVYYSAYSPIPHAAARLPGKSPPLVREHRLYQADWLMRFYGFAANELTTPEESNLDEAVDPKLAWALRNRQAFPVDVNSAPREMLLRVPGIGAKNVKRILSIRRLKRLRLADLARLNVAMNRARAFLIAADHNPDAALIDKLDLRGRIVSGFGRVPRDRQLSLFDAQSGQF